MDKNYKLIYFNSKGRAEFIRYIFAYSEVKFEDFRFEVNDWSRFVPYTDFNNVPVLVATNTHHQTFEVKFPFNFNNKKYLI